MKPSEVVNWGVAAPSAGPQETHWNPTPQPLH